jgi:CRISPR-associated protein Cas5d
VGFIVDIKGERACFTRPELKVERVSYDVITPSAARGILEAIFWKPAIKYVIDEIAVCSPIAFENIRRNEVNFKAPSSSSEPKSASDDRTQRAAVILKNVHYIITAHFEPVKEKLGDGDRFENGSFNHGKFSEMLTRRLKNGQHHHMPYLGTREFPAQVRLVEGKNSETPPIEESRQLGLMLYDIDYIKDAKENVTDFVPTYFYAELKNGIMDLRNVEVLR